MRYLIAIIAALAWLIPAPASAQIVSLPNLYTPDAASTNYPAGSVQLDVRRQQNVCIELTAWLATGSADTETNAFHFVPVVYGGARSTSAKLSDGFLIVLKMNGDTPVRAVTNFTIRGYPALELHSITNNALDGMTNTIRYSVKPVAP